MNVIESIKKAKGETLFSFEILPPLKGAHIGELFGRIDPLMEFNPSFINVTYHREEYVYRKRANGLLEKQATRKRPGTVGICTAILNKYHIETVPHLTCGGFTEEETEDALIDLNFLGINNVLALRGDPMKSDKNFVPTENGHEYAVDLVKQIENMNHGKYLSDEIVSPSPSAFCAGVAGYPEKHFESMNLKTDLRHLKEKVEAGAEYIVTQMFFDNQKFFDFVDKCRAIGINVLIIPGLKPITVKGHIQFLPKTFNIDFPDDLADELENCKSNLDINQVGIEWCINQSKELKKAGVPSLHYYTMGKSDTVRKIVSEVY